MDNEERRLGSGCDKVNEFTHIVRVLFASFSLPFLIYLVGYYPLQVSAPSVLLYMLAYYYAIKNESDVFAEAGSKIHSLRKYFPAILLSFSVTVLSGGSRLFSTSRNWDWIKHDAILHDLIHYDWPVVYSLTERGADVLVYYVSYYILPALSEKYFSFNAHWVLLLQTFVLFALLFSSLMVAIKKNALLVIVLGLLVSVPFTESKPLILLCWIPTQHALAVLYAFVLIVYVQQRRTLGLAVLSVPAIFMFSPFVAAVYGFILLFLWLSSRDLKKSAILYYGAVSVALLLLLYSRFRFLEIAGVLGLNEELYYDPSLYVGALLLTIPISILLRFSSRKGLTLAVATLITVFAVITTKIGVHAELQRIGLALVLLIFLYQFNELLQESGAKHSWTSFYHLMAVVVGLFVAVVVGLFKVYEGLPKPFISPTNFINTSIPLIAPNGRLPVSQYVAHVPKSHKNIFIQDVKVEMSQLYRGGAVRDIASTDVSLSTENDGIRLCDSVEPGVYKLVLRVTTPQHGENVGFTLVSDLSKPPILYMPARSYALYSSATAVHAGSKELPFYFSLPDKVEQILITTKIPSGYKRTDYTQTDAVFDISVVGLYKVAAF